MKLICFPFAGGSSLTYRNWGKELGIEVSVAPLPGREARSGDPQPVRMAALVDDLLPRILPAMKGPFALFGHSMGAQIAFAVASELHRRSAEGPKCLLLSGTGAPHLPDRFPPKHALPEPQLIEELRKYGGTPTEVLDEPELLAYFLPILRADFAVTETYHVTVDETVPYPIHALGGTGDEWVNREELDGWLALTTGGGDTKVFDGGHFFITEQRAQVIAHVRDKLALYR